MDSVRSIWIWAWLNNSVAQIPEYISFTSQNTPFCNRNVHMSSHFCYKIVIMGPSALWDLRDGTIPIYSCVQTGRPSCRHHADKCYYRGGRYRQVSLYHCEKMSPAVIKTPVGITMQRNTYVCDLIYDTLAKVKSIRWFLMGWWQYQLTRHFTNDIFKFIFVNKKFRIFIQIWLKLVRKIPIDNYDKALFD